MRFLSLIHALIGLTSLCGAAPTGKLVPIKSSVISPSTLAPSRKLPDDEVGLPGQLAWEAWLIIAKRPDAESSFESATVPRRIAPKSIFVAPSRDDQSQCSDGYKRNETGHCVQDTIKIDPMISRREFLRKRLNMFPPRVNINDSPAVDSDPVKVNLGNEDNGPLEFSLVQVPPGQGSGSPKEEAVMTIYEVGNATTRIDTTKDFHELPARGIVVPVVDAKNQTIIEIVNATGLKQAVENITESNLGGDEQPTVILLVETKTSAGSTQFPERTEPSVTSEVTTVQEPEETTLTEGLEETTTPEIPEAISTTIYPEDDADDPTESNDEIMLHGEAGSLISTSSALISTKTEEGNVSSESSISGDMIMETTLLDLNSGTTPSQSDLDGFREIFEAEKLPEVVSSPQDSHGSRVTKRTGDPTISSSIDTSPQESMRYVSRQEENDRSHLQQRRTTSGQNRVRFPDDPRLQPSGFVAFPSDHQSNSINGNLDGRRVQSIPKSVPPEQKTYYRFPPGWRVSNHQHQAAARNGNQQLQNQMLLRFWARMPLFRDPSLPIGGPNQSSRISTMVNNQRDRVVGQAVRGGQVQTG